jgi:hypothetical protein
VTDREFTAVLRALLRKDDCGLKGCNNTHAELIELLPVDPLDGTPTLINLCPEHYQWGIDRNEFVERLHEELREAQDAIEERYSEQLQQIATPEGGDLAGDAWTAETDDNSLRGEA